MIFIFQTSMIMPFSWSTDKLLTTGLVEDGCWNLYNGTKFDSVLFSFIIIIIVKVLSLIIIIILF